MKRTLSITASVGLAGLMLVACSGTSDTVITQIVTATATSEPTSTPTTTDAQLDVTAAIDVALASVAGVAVAGDLTEEAGRSAWSIEVRDPNIEGIEVYVDAVTGEILREQPERLSDLADGTLPALTAQEGITAALAAQTGGRVTAFDLDREEGVVVWSVVVRTSGGLLEVYVDANSGQVLFSEPAD